MSLFMWCVSVGINIIWFSVLNASLKKRFSRWITYITELLCLIFANYVSIQFVYLSFVRSALPLAIMLALCFIVFDESWQRILFCFAMVVFTAFLNDFIGLGLYLPAEVTGELYYSGGRYNYVYILYFLTGAILFFILYLLLNNRRLKIGIKECLLFSGFPLSQAFLIHICMHFIYRYQLDIRMPYFLGAVAVSLLADVGLLFAIFYISQRRQLMQENTHLMQLVSNQEKYYSSLAAQYENVRRMRHDMDNQMLTMRALIDQKETKQAAEHADELVKNYFERNAGVCENIVADAFLQTKAQEAKSKGIELKMQVQIDNKSAVSNIDIIRALGNMLDNAIESCSGFKEPRIKLVCCNSKGYMIIICENPTADEKARKKQRIEGLERGIGTKVLDSIAKKYKGFYSCESENGIFRSKLILSLEEKAND